MTSQAEYSVQTTVGAQDAGYIHEDDLRAFLNTTFPAADYPNFTGPEEKRFHIEQRDDQFSFLAPRDVQRAEYRHIMRQQ